ncbi:helix-turn-helix transcriptional regulator [Nitratiruptor sp. SB155-2]|uniref:helix-turn-helix transcriptional regulator n=1 Tax=Nitratiruptor sp. (strain SB155-2) TaxID=387092 RepID=UPI0001586FA7|nr:hypothetical protein [Nitratiruptor sp. SB155-2]BAF70796.1 hypothetical protein NIS_1690 [Nitratiruptor sp. SB155-2]
MTEKEKFIYDNLNRKYKRIVIGKRELAYELGVSVSTIDNYICRGYGIPPYKKLGTSNNAKVVFNLVDVAIFLAATIKTN